MTARLSGLIAAPHTPMEADGALALEQVEAQAGHFVATGVDGVFVGGSTGEWSSLTTDERMQLARRWGRVAPEAGLAWVVHVGHTCLADACALASQAAELGAGGIAALAPCFFKPSTVVELVDWLARIAARAPELPFYYYDIPGLSGVELPSDELLVRARERIPSFAGIKYTKPDLVQLQRCLALARDEVLLWGSDETLLAALPLGVHGAVGSTYNFAAPLYVRLRAAFEAGDLERARLEQLRSVRLIQTLAGYGYLGAAKAVMGFLGVECGPARPPNAGLDEARRQALRAELEALGFFEWTACS